MLSDGQDKNKVFVKFRLKMHCYLKNALSKLKLKENQNQ